jgi:RNA polymerase sigma factor (sigma-70 family)
LSKEKQRYVNRTPTELEDLAEILNHLRMEDDSESQVLEAELQRVLEKLPRPSQIAWIRHRRDGWEYAQIAEELGLSYHQARRHLRQAMAHCDAYFATDPTRQSSAKDRA